MEGLNEALRNCKFDYVGRVEVVTAAASCLKKILATESGSGLLKKFAESKQEQLLWYLEPFRPSKKKRASFSLLSNNSVPPLLGHKTHVVDYNEFEVKMISN